jgi:hypothetical protein
MDHCPHGCGPGISARGMALSTRLKGLSHSEQSEAGHTDGSSPGGTLAENKGD